MNVLRRTGQGDLRLLHTAQWLHKDTTDGTAGYGTPTCYSRLCSRSRSLLAASGHHWLLSSGVLASRGGRLALHVSLRGHGVSRGLGGRGGGHGRDLGGRGRQERGRQLGGGEALAVQDQGLGAVRLL